MANAGRLFTALMMAASLTACAGSLRDLRVADIQDNPGRFQDRMVRIDGVVTSSWGIPLVPFRLYKVDDGTGELTVISQGSRIPARGAHVSVRGRVEDVAVVNGQALGLHIREEGLRIAR
mgnify:CR=1 FL=1